MSDYFGVSPDGYQKPLYLTNNLSDLVDKAAARTNLGVASSDDVMKAANPIGAIIAFYGSVAPYGYLPCSGQTVSSTTFPDLVTFLGGTTSAVLPDLRGEFLRGWDNGRGVDPSRGIRTFQADDIKSHTHTVPYLWIRDVQGAGGGTIATTGGGISWIPSSTISIASTGGTETRSRNVSVLYCIKAYDTPVSATALNLTSLINEFQTGRSLTGFVNLRSSATGLSALVSTTADEITLKTAATQYRTFTNVSVSINTASVGLNGLDTGTLAVSTWYSTWVISDGTNVAGLISLDALNPTLPSGYTYKIRTGWIRTDSNATNKFPLGFIQAGRKVQLRVAAGTNLVTPVVLASGVAGSVTTPTWISVSTAGAAPSTSYQITVTLVGSNAGDAMLSPNGGHGVLVDGPPSIFAASAGQSTRFLVGIKLDVVLEGAYLFWASSAATGRLFAAGWEDSI